MYSAQVPICVACANASERLPRTPPLIDIGIVLSLTEMLTKASAAAEAATQAFASIAKDIPSGLPHPDGVQRIENAAHKMNRARDEMLRAHARVSDYLTTGILPEDLKPS
jgi:hypothetical protein